MLSVLTVKSENQTHNGICDLPYRENGAVVGPRWGKPPLNESHGM